MSHTPIFCPYPLQIVVTYRVTGVDHIRDACCSDDDGEEFEEYSLRLYVNNIPRIPYDRFLNGKIERYNEKSLNFRALTCTKYNGEAKCLCYKIFTAISVELYRDELYSCPTARHYLGKDRVVNYDGKEL